MFLGVFLHELVPLGSVDAVGTPGEPHDDGDDGGLEEEHHPIGGSYGWSGQAGHGGRGQQQGRAEEDRPHLSLDHVEFVEDGQKGAAVEPLVTVPPDVEAARGQPLRELADVEDGGHQKPEAVAIEEAGGGGGCNEGGGGGGVRRPGEETVEDRRGRDEEWEEEHKGSDDVSILPPPLASIAARQDAYDRHKTCARNVEGLEENAELWDCIGGCRSP